MRSCKLQVMDGAIEQTPTITIAKFLFCRSSWEKKIAANHFCKIKLSVIMYTSNYSQ